MGGRRLCARQGLTRQAGFHGFMLHSIVVQYCCTVLLSRSAQNLCTKILQGRTIHTNNAHKQYTQIIHTSNTHKHYTQAIHTNNAHASRAVCPAGSNSWRPYAAAGLASILIATSFLFSKVCNQAEVSETFTSQFSVAAPWRYCRCGQLYQIRQCRSRGVQ